MLKTPDIFKAITCRSMDGAQLRAVCRIDVLYAAVVIEPDFVCIAKPVVHYHVNVTILVHVERSVGIIAVFVAVGTAIVEVRSTCVGQVLLRIVLYGLELIAVAGDDEAVNLPILPLIVHSVSFNAGYVAVLVVGYALGVTCFAILVDIIYFWVAKESKSLSK